MKKHIYYRIEMELASPMSIGSDISNESDHDVVRKKDGRPYIPATSIAGVFRHIFDNDRNMQNRLFGMIDGEYSQKSQLIFYDAEPVSEAFTKIRDGVKLENKVGVTGAKFDMEVIETGAEFLTFLEISDAEEDIIENTEKMLSMLSDGILRFGTKISRGYGKVNINSLKKAEFDIDSELEKWLDFDVFDDNCWNSISEYNIADSEKSYTKIKIGLRQNGAISIREYSTDVDMPDYKHMTLKKKADEEEGKGVIPGTSWAGAFRDRFRDFSDDETTDTFFGYVIEKSNEDDNCQKSKITFSESVIEDGKMKTITRNSIDRFSFETKNTALYTERTCYNGKTELEIILNDDVTPEERAILSAVILDIHYGLLSVGGLTSIGRGMFSIEKIVVNNEDRTDLLKPESVTKLLEA